MPILILLCFLLFPTIPLSALEGYDVKIEGNLTDESRSLIESASQLLALQESPPATPAGLRSRAESDIENMLTVLHSQAYFGAKISLDYDFEHQPPLVSVYIDPGPQFQFSSFTLTADKNGTAYFPYETISLSDLGVFLGAPAHPKEILKAEERLLTLMSSWGYPLASISKREVYADLSGKTVRVSLVVNSGPSAYFGPVSIQGNNRVLNQFFYKKIAWSPGAPYNPEKIERTHNALEASGLFSSIHVHHAESPDEFGHLPMIIEVIESKPRSIGWGATYNTDRGLGVALEWEHRNIGGLGERLSFDTELWSLQKEAHLLYVKPDFRRRSEDLLLLAELFNEETKGFTESSISLSSSIERQVNDQMRTSYGVMYKWLKDSRSEKNGTFNLLKMPLYMRWSNANHLLDPTAGSTIHLKLTPTMQIIEPYFLYGIATLTAAHYFSLTANKRWILATRIIAGTILGTDQIPGSERFYEGSETVMRGYRYQTVSPLECHKPIGGRSMLICSAELRVRATDTFGWAAFYDIGNVAKNPVPRIDAKQLQSVGCGLRYHTAVGPLRLDLAVPLNRREKLDPRFQIYLSIGQAF